jgi:formylglycine-generating enzyme required for sulfatase activity
LAAAARIGIVHRDLKPSNLLIDREGTLKIADFGLVGLAGETAVAPAELPYASPERVAGKPCDERSDLYSLGAIAHVLLTRQAPVWTSDGAIEPLRAHDRTLHADLEEAVMRCLRPEPEERWQTAQALVAALEELLLAGKVLRRRRWSWTIAAAAAAAGIAVGSLWSWRGQPAEPAPAPRAVAASAPEVASGTNAGTVAPAAPVAPTPPPSVPVIAEPPPPPIVEAPAPVIEAKAEPPPPAPAPPPVPEAAPTPPPVAVVEPAPAPVVATPVVERQVPKDDVPAAPAPVEAASAPITDAASATTITMVSGSDRIGRWADLRVLGVVQRFRWCPPGLFLMGSPDGERHRGRDEDIHQVTLTRGFWLADTECSQALWITVMGSSPSAVQELSHPVERISWDQTHVFMARLNRLCPGVAARLPTETEWEYACRAGGADTSALESTGWFERTSGGQTHAIAQLQPNAWGLFDLRGNVGEWCEDAYGPYPKPVVIDPPPPPGSAHVVRGGSCRDDASDCRPAHRSRLRQAAASEWVGFRLALGCGEKPPSLSSADAP